MPQALEVSIISPGFDGIPDERYRRGKAAVASRYARAYRRSPWWLKLVVIYKCWRTVRRRSAEEDLRKLYGGMR